MTRSFFGERGALVQTAPALLAVEDGWGLVGPCRARPEGRV